MTQTAKIINMAHLVNPTKLIKQAEQVGYWKAELLV